MWLDGNQERRFIVLNQVVVVGRLIEEPITEKISDTESKGNILLAVPRSYKNENGEYETDYLPCTLMNKISENVVEYCHKSDLLGIKGRLVSNVEEDEQGNKQYSIKIIAEKVTFLASKKDDGE